MSFSINEFKSQLVGGGARPTLFEVRITNPVTGVADFKIPFMVKSSQIPGSSLGSFTVPYFGRQVKYAGDRTFEDWTVTVINDEDFAIRNAMEAWSNSINSHVSNQRALPQDYKSDAQVIQYGKDGTVLRQYTFQGIYPLTIDPIDLNWETQDTIEEFNITFQYDLWVVDGGVTGSSVN